MTVSVNRRQEDIRKALLRMADKIADDYCFAYVFQVTAVQIGRD